MYQNISAKHIVMAYLRGLISLYVLIRTIYILQVWNLGPSKVETVVIEFEIPHQLNGPNGERIFMQVFEPQVS
jgi:hypothetical protein